MRTEKLSILNEVIERVKASDFCFVLNYGGLKVTQLTALRQGLAKLDSRAMVVKNTYLAKVAKELGWADVSALLAGPTALVTGSGDAADVEALSKLPSKDAMRGILLGTLQAPATSLVRVLNAPLLNVLYALKAYEEKKGGGAAEPAA
jgi:large subunit ribosomal protein L10